MVTSKENLVQKQLEWDNRITTSDIEVKVTNSTAELSGSVPSYYQKIVAENDALSIAGINAVLNNLTVAFPEGDQPRSDKEIKDSIDNIFMWDNRIDTVDMDVKVDSGIVTLEGTVDTYWKRFEAENIAFRVSGVLDVVNKLDVRWNSIFRDEAIEADVNHALDRNLKHRENIQVEVSGGIVTLKGSVNNIIDKKVAEEKAAYTAGVKNVINSLSVEENQ
jgi:osmotically-inducible protein OsmY